MAEEISFTYTDLLGKEVVKVLVGKKPFIRTSAGILALDLAIEQWDKDNFIPPLYHQFFLKDAKVIYITADETIADTLRTASCDATTALGKWNKAYNKLFLDKTVILCLPDKTANKIAKSLYDIVTEVRVHPPEFTNPEEVFNNSTQFVIQKKQKKATREQYYKLFENILNKPKKCIFSDKLMTLSESGLWNPAVNYLDIIKSEAAVLNDNGHPTLSGTLIQPHFFAFEHQKSPEFVVELPEWDGRDRISEMAYLVKLKESAGVSEITFSELLKEWMAKVFLRLHDPMIQNKIIVLQGGQGIGKDTWVSMLVDGLGQFAVPLSVVGEDKDTYLNLHRGLIMKISEFDKTAKAEVSTLKDIITAPTTNLRAPYDRDAKVRLSRCSFISSANIENLLRDHTGNRRYMIFEIESIEYLYRGWTKEKIRDWQLQVLAEAKHLAKIDYLASEASQKEMRNYIEIETPSDPADDTVEEFLSLLRKDVQYAHKTELLETEVLSLRHELKKLLGLNVRGISTQLRSKIGICKRSASGKRYWSYKIPDSNVIEDEGFDS